MGNEDLQKAINIEDLPINIEDLQKAISIERVARIGLQEALRGLCERVKKLEEESGVDGEATQKTAEMSDMKDYHRTLDRALQQRDLARDALARMTEYTVETEAENGRLRKELRELRESVDMLRHGLKECVGRS